MRLKIQILMMVCFTSLMIFACKSKKETVSSTAAADPLRPGDAELAAVKDKFPGITTEQLSDGYAVYTVACTNCHGKKNIYSRTEEEWTKAINRMAPKAKITEEQKDHLTKYIFAMKASHPGQKK